MIPVCFEHVSKSYPIYSQILTGLKGSLLHVPQTLQRFRRNRFMALNDVSFEVEQGESIGLIGSNGSGKSTTLALIAGVLRAQSGTVDVRGRVGPLLELGAGFHPELSGRENILLNGILLGLTRREVLAKMGEIISFSELEPFLDQPLRTFSSGMIARLGFSVAAHLDPEILLVDEVLAVGDLHFQAKCRKKIAEFRRRNVTIVLVSHSSDEIRRLCTRALWLDGGKIVAQGDPDSILPCYEAAALPNPAAAPLEARQEDTDRSAHA
jgi:lipopolysaccharide transport system ATP-binding protein